MLALIGRLLASAFVQAEIAKAKEEIMSAVLPTIEAIVEKKLRDELNKLNPTGVPK